MRSRLLTSLTFIQHFLLLSKILLLQSTRAFLVRHRIAVQAATAFSSSCSPSFLRLPSAAHMSSNSNPSRPTPPLARRDEDNVVWVGAPPPGWDPTVPRQSANSKYPLVDPPIALRNPYGWMRSDDRSSEEVLKHLEAENEYTREHTKHLDGLRTQLYEDFLSYIQETDYTTPRPDGDYYYYTRTYKGKSYTVHCRAPRDYEAAHNVHWDGKAESPILPGEQVVLDINHLAEGKPYCSTGTVKQSPSHKLLAYAADFTGDEVCHLYVKNIETGEMVLESENLNIYGTIRWGADDDTLFYLVMDDTHRPYQLYRKKLNSDQEDELLLEEHDRLFWMGIYKSLDGKYLFCTVESKETAEAYYLDLHDPTAQLQCIAKRRPKVLYDVEHHNGRWWIQSNVGGLPNMALWTAPAVPNCENAWQFVTVQGEDGSSKPAFEGGYERSLSGITCFSGHVIASGREGGLPRIWVLSLPDNSTPADEAVLVKKMEMLTFAEDAYDVRVGEHYEADSDRLVVVYDSLVTPTQSLEIAMGDTSDRCVLKQRKVPGYIQSHYACERTTVTARDGTKIPVSLVYHKETMEKAKSGIPVHVHLYGYGSYGSSTEADFRATRLPLLDRGMVYVLAHVRGGSEMGRQWYEEPNGAKYLCKKNTFNDFVDVARWLVEERKLTRPDMLSCEGRSAGGLLIGASINQAPELFQAAILGVPFVDLICTMTDATIPLTVVEWEEWGNPNEEKYLQYMMEYCPMENVRPGAKYPACLLTGGLHDPRVQYWEPAKFAASLRYAQGPESGPVCVKIDMSAGHFSASDRYKYLQELAFDYAFLLDHVGLAEAPATEEEE